MGTFICIFIFLAKIIENGLATLRVIVIASGKKWLGATLQLCISFIWVLGTGSTIIGINKNPLKIVFFCLGAFVGSLLGSITYEKMKKKTRADI